MGGVGVQATTWWVVLSSRFGRFGTVGGTLLGGPAVKIRRTGEAWGAGEAGEAGTIREGGEEGMQMSALAGGQQ